MGSHTPADDSASPPQGTTNAARDPIATNSLKSPTTPPARATKRKIESIDELATPVRAPRIQIDRLVKKLKRKSTVGFLRRYDEQLAAMIPSVDSSQIILTKAPMPNIKRRRLVFLTEPASPPPLALSMSGSHAAINFDLSATAKEKESDVHGIVPLLEPNECSIDQVADAFSDKLSFHIPEGRCFDFSSVMSCL